MRPINRRQIRPCGAPPFLAEHFERMARSGHPVRLWVVRLAGPPHCAPGRLEARAAGDPYFWGRDRSVAPPPAAVEAAVARALAAAAAAAAGRTGAYAEAVARGEHVVTAE